MNRLFFRRTLWLYCLLAACPVVQSFLVSETAAADKETSRLWGVAGERWKSSGRLPDFSFAGYHRGERPLPERRADLSVKDFGAVGDGKTDDTAAFQRAVREAPGKVIAVPPGRYVITEIIEIRAACTVLLGAGTQRTTIYLPKPLEQIRSNMSTTTSGGQHQTTHGRAESFGPGAVGMVRRSRR